MRIRPTVHLPVLLDEVLQSLDPQPGQRFVDATVGGGGHTVPLAKAVGPEGQILALDRDAEAIERCRHVVDGLPVTLIHASYDRLPDALVELGWSPLDGALLDLGLSSDQLADADRGFSFQADGELDLRFDMTTGEPAWRLLERLSERDLANLIYEYGEERFSRRIAREVVASRRQQPIRTAMQLAELVRRCVPRSKNHRIDPATRTFQALRIATNEELRRLESALHALPSCLVPGARVAVISFHSLEDRIVKNFFRSDPRFVVLTKKPIRPNQAELARNPRSRSARLRVASRQEDA